MKILKNDKFRVFPASAIDSNVGKQPNRKKPSKMTGTVIAVNSAHGVALLDFGTFRECFSFYGKGGLYAAERVF